MLHHAKLPKAYWGEAILIVAHFQNQHSTKAMNGWTPYGFGMVSHKILHIFKPLDVHHMSLTT
jgi:hypothetical protein